MFGNHCSLTVHLLQDYPFLKKFAIIQVSSHHVNNVLSQNGTSENINSDHVTYSKHCLQNQTCSPHDQLILVSWNQDVGVSLSRELLKY
jgi:hypothetical protein